MDSPGTCEKVLHIIELPSFSAFLLLSSVETSTDRSSGLVLKRVNDSVDFKVTPDFIFDQLTSIFHRSHS